MSGYFKALLFLACALPVSSDGPLFTDVTQDAGITFVNQSGGADKQHIIETQSAGGGFWDYDLDGHLDLFLTSGVRPDSTTGTALYRGMGHGAFSDATEGSGTELSGWNMGVAFADYDGDGDLDLYVANYIMYERGGPPFYDRWCVHNGVHAGGRHQMREVLTGSSFQAQSDTRLHFGLGPAYRGRYRNNLARRRAPSLPRCARRPPLRHSPGRQSPHIGVELCALPYFFCFSVPVPVKHPIHRKPPPRPPTQRLRPLPPVAPFKPAASSPKPNKPIVKHCNKAPANPQYHYYLGVTLHAQSRFAEAQTQFEKALELKPDYAGPRIALGKMLYDVHGKVEEARQFLSEALETGSQRGRSTLYPRA